MARQNFFGSSQSLVGAALIAAGVLGLYGEFHAATAHLGVGFGGRPSAWLPAALFALSKISLIGHFPEPAAFFRNLALSAWPLLLVITGALLPDDQGGRRGSKKNSEPLSI